LYQIEKVQLYVNRGVGNVGLGLRLNAPPEVSLLTLRAGVASPAEEPSRDGVDPRQSVRESDARKADQERVASIWNSP
jgi:hypothetical protein